MLTVCSELSTSLSSSILYRPDSVVVVTRALIFKSTAVVVVVVDIPPNDIDRDIDKLF